MQKPWTRAGARKTSVYVLEAVDGLDALHDCGTLLLLYWLSEQLVNSVMR